MSLNELCISEAGKGLAEGNFSSVELTKSCLKKIKETDDTLNAFVSIDEESALKQANEADEKRKKDGTECDPLCGIPLSIKDLICIKGSTTTCGSRILKNYRPPYNATVIERLEERGAVFIGKTAMDEFAMGSTSETCFYGVPGNPYNKDYVAGGSSGGSAVSVAATQCLGSLGSDTGGSIRQPASLCGVTGLKPTYGCVSRFGLVAFASSLDQIGPICRSVEDTALLMNGIAGYDPYDSTSVRRDKLDYCSFLEKGVEGLRIGIPAEYFGEGLDSEVEKTVRHSIEILQDNGAELVDISLPRTEYCVAVYYLIAPAEASSNLARYDGVAYGHRDDNTKSLLEMYKETRSTGFGDEVKRRILIGTYALSSGYYEAYYKKASQVRKLILDDFKKAYEKCDLLISPVTPTPAWKKGDRNKDPLSLYLSDILTLSANLAGIPGMSVPGGFSDEGLPIGVQLQGPHFKEGVLLQAARVIEKELALNTVCSL